MSEFLLRCLIIAGGVFLARIVPENATLADWEIYVIGIYIAIVLDMDVSNYGKPTKSHQK